MLCSRSSLVCCHTGAAALTSMAPGTMQNSMCQTSLVLHTQPTSCRSSMFMGGRNLAWQSRMTFRMTTFRMTISPYIQSRMAISYYPCRMSKSFDDLLSQSCTVASCASTYKSFKQESSSQVDVHLYYHLHCAWPAHLRKSYALQTDSMLCSKNARRFARPMTGMPTTPCK